MQPLILIPARMQASRLPGKPMLRVGDAPMIVQVWRRAVAAHCGAVAVATDAQEIADAIEAQGGTAVITRPDHASGSDRIFEALQTLDPQGLHEIIVNVQGDMPTLEPHLIQQCIAALTHDATVDIATLACEISEGDEHKDPAVVKAVISFYAPNQGRALYFTRAEAPANDGPRYHHIGMYAYRRSALARFVALPPSPLELREKLEQLRALEDGMRLDVAVVNTIPLGVDTPETLEKARKIYATYS